MKKKYLLGIVALLLVGAITFCIVSCCSGVNPDPTDEDIDNRLLYNKIFNEAKTTEIKALYPKDEVEKELKGILRSEDRDEVEASLEFDMTAYALCVEKRIQLDVTEADEIAIAEYEALKNDPSRAVYYNALTAAFKKFDVSEEKYIKLYAKEQLYSYNKFYIKKDFEHLVYDSSSDKDIDEQFKEYIEDNM